MKGYWRVVALLLLFFILDGRKGFLDVRDLVRGLEAAGVGPLVAPAPGTWNPLADLEPDGAIDYKGLALHFWAK